MKTKRILTPEEITAMNRAADARLEVGVKILEAMSEPEPEPKITQADLRHDAPRDYLHVIVECGGVEYQRNFEPDANDDRILEDWHRDKKTWRVI